MAKVNVLVMCNGNSARSQMTEGFLRKHASDRFHVYSAGIDPIPVHPLAVEVMREAGIDIGAQRSKHFSKYLGIIPMYYMIIVCQDSDNKCPAVWPGCFEYLSWPFEDPAAFNGTPEEQIAKFREVRDKIEKRVRSWLADLGSGTVRRKTRAKAV